MIKKIVSLICSIFVGISCLFAVACSMVKFSLRFMVDDKVYATVSTNGNEVIQMPKDPVKEEYIFDGWYWDKDVWRNQFTARSLLDTPLSSNMEVYAHFVDESYLKGTDINIKTAEKVNIEGIGDVFYLTVRNNQFVCKFNDYVEINPHSSWTLSSDIAGNNIISSKTVEVVLGDNPLYYIYVTDKNDFHETYIVLVHRNYMFPVFFNTNGGSSCSTQEIEEGYYLENIPVTTRKGYTFDSWSYDFKNSPIRGSVTANAIWTANQYKITYNPNGGTMNNEIQTVTFDQRYNLFTPYRNGYTFRGWKTSNGSYFDESGIWSTDHDVVLTAQWEINYYSLTYELNGGSSSGISFKSSYTVEDSFVLPNPTKTGYSFKGWSLNQSLDGAKIDYKVEKGTTGNLKFYAKWEANSYTITYDVNGGDELDSNTQQVTYDSDTTLTVPTKTGYDFAGWYNGNTKVSDGDWHIANDVTLTARWEAIEYAIKYNLNGGTNNSNNPLKYTIESDEITLLNPEREGYTFVGWTNSDFETPTLSMTIPHGSTGEKEFTANWQANTYTVTFDVNGGNEIVDNVKEYVFDSNVSLPEATRTGYNFAGWYYGTQLVISGSWKIAENVTLVARWSIEEYNIQYQLNGGINNSANPSSYNYEDGTIILEDPTRTGYTFLGWTTSGVETPTKNLQIIHNSTGDKLFIANWQANTYTVTYDVNGGNSIGKDSEDVVFDEVLTLINPTRTGYTFSGWYEGDTLYESGVWKTAKDVNLIARWTPNNYTITKENGSGAGTSTVTYDSNYNLGTSSKDGYDFVGWFTEMYGQGTRYTDEDGNSLNPYTDANDQTLYASFVYHITFVSNGGSYVPNLTLHENECLSDAIISEKENRTFAGWFTDAELTKPASHTEPLGNVTLYAKWLEEVEPTKLTYSSKNGAITVSGTSFDGDTFVLPSHIGGQEVKTISNGAFANNSSFMSITIPENVDKIGSGIFKNCNSIVDLTLPFIGYSLNKSSGNDSVFGWIFDYTSSSSASGTVKQGLYYYYIPSSIKNVTITSQTTFASYAFCNCSSIISITLPSITEVLSSYAFSGCTSLKRLNSDIDGLFNIPACVSEISGNLFTNCLGIEEIVLPNYLSSIKGYAFSGCKNIKRFNSNNDGYLVVPDTCGEIGDYAFQGMNLITNVVIPESVTSIGSGALNGCNTIVNLTIPFVGSSLNKTSGSDSVFGWIFGYTSSASASGTTYQNAYLGPSRYFIPSTIKNVTVTMQTKFGQAAFHNCSKLESISISTSTETIGSYAFNGCTSLKRLNSNVDGVFNIPTGVHDLPNYSFTSCSGATEISFSNSVESIGEYAFSGCVNVLKFNSNNNGELIIPNTCKKIGNYAFSGMILMTDVIISESVTSIGSGALKGCNSIVNLTIPFIGSSLNKTSDYDSVFGWIFDYTSSSNASGTVRQRSHYYYIPSSVKNVVITVQTIFASYSFQNCENIEKIKIINYQQYTTINAYTFANCSSLLSLNSDEEGMFIISPETVYIGDYAFSGCSNIIKFNSESSFTLIVPSTCTYIGTYAFYRLVLIKNVTIPESVTSIGSGALNGCNTIVNLTIPFIGSSLNKASDYDSVFGYIFGYTSSSSASGTVRQGSYYYYIPSSIKSVVITVQTIFASYSFHNCSKIEAINIPASAKTINSYAFYGCTSLKRLNSDTDGVFNIPIGIRILSNYSFTNCTKVTQIYFSDRIESIGDCAFSGCVNVLKFNSNNNGELIVPNKCKSIGYSAFQGMNLITDVTIPESVTSIGSGALNGCNTIVNLTIPFIGSSLNKASDYDSVFGYIFGYTSSSSASGTVRQGSYYYYIPSSVKNVVITVQTIFAKCSFQNCNSLLSITMLKDADTSALYCFDNCKATINKTLDESPLAPWNGVKIASEFSSGSGTEQNPYVINSAAELAYLAEQVNSGNSYSGIYFVLGNDLNLNSHSIIIGDSANHPFSGIINGNRHVIRYLKISASGSYAGLFGYFDGSISNLGFEYLSITVDSTDECVYVGLFGYASPNAIIYDVYATGTITATGQTYVYAGGLVGYSEGQIYNAYSLCNVSCTSSGYTAYAGGLIGYLNNGTIIKSFASGNVSAKGATINYSRNGGLVGTNTNGSIINCFRLSSQVLTRYGTNGSAYNEEGEILNYDGDCSSLLDSLEWDKSIWDSTEQWPLFK